jgi:PIN domain nuclease of toxin-antitoxin system
VVDGPYLLDTSTVIWALTDPKRISKPARAALETGPLVLSVASYWEVVIKARKGLLRLADPVTWWARASALLGGTVLSIRVRHVSALHGLPEIHNDPFDRILIAQASAEGLALVTLDEQIRRYAIRTVW